MVTLKKMWVAYFIANRQSFASNKIVATSYDNAMALAVEWGDYKYGSRVKEIKIERSKGEVLADD